MLASGLAALFGMDRYYRAEIERGNADRLAEALADTRYRLSEILAQYVLLTDSLRAFLLARPELPDSGSFDSYASLLLTDSPELRALQYADSGHVIRYIYPLAGNEDALGLDLMTRPAAEVVERAMATGKTSVSEPVTTVQGSLAVVIRSPMFREGSYLGLAAVVVDISPLLERVLRDLPPAYESCLQDRAGRVFWGDVCGQPNAMRATVPIANGLWHLTMRQGPDAQATPRASVLALIWGLGGALVVSIMLITYLLFQRVTGLAEAVEERTRALADSETRYRNLVETTDDNIVLTDLDHNILYANRAFYRSQGLESAVAGHKDAFARVDPEDRTRILNLLDRLEEEGRLSTEYRTRYGDGEWVNWQAWFSLNRDERGRPKSILMIAHDVTDRERAKQRTELQAQLLEATFASLNAAIFVIEPSDRSIVLCNAAVQDVFGYTPDELIGRGTEILHVDQVHHQRFAELGEPTLAEQGFFQSEYEMRHRDGRIIQTVSTVRSIAARESWASGLVVSVVRDITEQKRMEVERNELEERYLRAQKLEAVGQLTAGIAHDFNNLLLGITGNAEIIQLSMSDDDPAKSQIESILDAGFRAADLINQLLVFSRKEVVRPQVVDLNEVIGKTGEMLQRVIGEDIEFELDLAQDLWPVFANRGQLDQVVTNLALNARDAMPNGGTLTISTRNVVLDQAHVDERLDQQPGEYVRMQVRDSGMGMSEQVRSHIFEPFFTTKAPGRGTGLGLATVYGIVESFGGHILVHSEEGKGSTFDVYLPRHDPDGDADPGDESPEPAKHALSRGQGTILLVEDESAVRKFAHDALTRQGFSVLTAQNRADALRVVEAHEGPIDLLLTDVVMPGGSGKELADELLSRYPDARVIYMSGYSYDIISVRGLLEDGIELLRKPFSVYELVEKVQKALG